MPTHTEKTTEDIEAAVVDYVRRELLSGSPEAAESLAADDDLLGSGLVGSLGVMQLIRFLEERYGVKVPPADVTIDHFMTASAIAAYVKSLPAADAAPSHG